MRYPSPIYPSHNALTSQKTPARTSTTSLPPLPNSLKSPKSNPTVSAPPLPPQTPPKTPSTPPNCTCQTPISKSSTPLNAALASAAPNPTSVPSRTATRQRSMRGRAEGAAIGRGGVQVWEGGREGGVEVPGGRGCWWCCGCDCDC